MLQKHLNIRAPPGIGLKSDQVKKFSRPLYGKKEAGRLFQFSWQPKLLAVPGMQRTTAPSLFKMSDRQRAIAAFSDDHMRAGTDHSKRLLKPFDALFATHTTDRESFNFAGLDVRLCPGKIFFFQEAYTSQILYVDETAPLDGERRAQAQSNAHKPL